MRLALVAVLALLAAAGWQHRGDLPHSPFNHPHRIAYGHVSTAGAAARWLESSSGQGLRRAHCSVSSARPPAPTIPSFVAAGQVTIGTYSCRGRAARRLAHAWCVVAFRYEGRSSPPVIVWTAAYSRCRTLTRLEAKRSG